MPLSFPSNPTVGQQSTQNGRTYQWSGSAWELFTPTVAGGVTTDASLLTSGTLADARLSANVVLTGDARLSNARTPTAHKATHSTGGTDAIAPADIGAADASHTHTLSQITDAGTAASRAVPASGNATSTQVVLGSDTRLTDSRTPTSHTHGNISNAGAIGSTANLPVITTTSGVLTTGTFGTTANSFCQGNDSRLSDTRTPTDNSVTTAKIANGAVTTAKLADNSVSLVKIASTITDVVFGRASAGVGDAEAIACTSFGRALLDDTSVAAQRSTLGLGSMATETAANYLTTASASSTYLARAGGTMTGQVAVIAGNAGAPGLAIAGDTNTGIAQNGVADTVGLIAGGVECLRVTGAGSLATVVEGAGAGLYPCYVCRAWVNFQGNASSNLTGTYSQAGTTVTITTSVAHDLTVGQRVVLDFTSGAATDQGADVATVTSPTVFTATLTTSATTSGNVTLTRSTIRSGGNVTSVADAGTGSYLVNFFVPAPHANYATLVSVRHNSGVSLLSVGTADDPTQHRVQILTAAQNTGTAYDPTIVCVAVFY